MSMMYSGDANDLLFRICTIPYKGNKTAKTTPLELTIKNGSVMLNGSDTGIKCNKDEWLRVVLDLNTNTTNGYIYLNGRKF